ncbi:endophilin-A2-like isoform X4 [Echeneis naucrates]|uniref:endophilin-A2-like isoform X4 n=1 Tax=Echeneis naucrates TaxID=173247 RepID=UPI0011143FDC|nr:endophilin-A2-like isoform X4 [Echeneis naucrates]
MEPPSLTQLSPGNCGCLASFTSTVQSFKTCWSAAVLSAHSHRLFLTLFPRRAPGGIPDGVKMSVAGFKKQFYKASQLMSEKVGGAEGTKLDEDFKDLERKADITSKAVVEVINKTSEYLQPNPATRAKLSMLNTVSKIRGQVNSPGYPQPEGLLGECMTKYGRDMGEDTNFGAALIDVGESMKRMAEVKDSLDIDVKQNFIDPLQAVAEKDIKDIQHHLKKLEGRRLDYDYKKKRQGKIQDEEIRQALEKFHESKELAESSMHNLLETDVEQVSQLSSFVESLLQYHREAAQIFEELSDKLRERVVDAQNRPRREYTPKPRPAYDFGELEQSNGGYSTAATSPPSCVNLSEPCCKALYDFEPENEGELGFHEGDIITLVSQIDENWFEGTLRGRSGYFPNNYVEVMVPLSH